MATRSNIGYYENGIFHSVYCHFDGYPEGVGKTLLENYNDIDKVIELICYGEISSLGNTIEDSCFYHRDRDEDLIIDTCETEESDELIVHQEYLYIFMEDTWYIKGYVIDFIKVEELLKHKGEI